MKLGAPALAVLSVVMAACAGMPRSGEPVEQGQSLFRVEVRSADREANLRLVLRYGGERRFQLAAADLVGRTIWTFAVAGDHFLWADHRRQSYCRGETSVAMSLPLLRMELSPAAVPQILLGRLPIQAPEGLGEAADGRLRFADGSGRRWLAEYDAAGMLTGWELRDSAGLAIASWQRQEADFELILPQRGLTVRWRRASSEPLPEAWVPFNLPAGFEESACDKVQLP